MKRKNIFILAAVGVISLGIIGYIAIANINTDDPSIVISESVEDQSEDQTVGVGGTTGKKTEYTTSGTEKKTTETEKQTITENQTTATTEDSNKTTAGTTTERQTVTTTEAVTQTTTQTSTTSRTEPTTQVATQAVTDATTTTQATTEARQTEATTQATTTEATTAHQHNWVAIYKTVHHDEVGHTEMVDTGDSKEIIGDDSTPVTPGEARWPIYETHTLCNGCGYDFTANGKQTSSGCPRGCGAGSHGESVFTGKNQILIPIYTEKYIIDQVAYDEKIIDHYECSCGAKKN